MPPRHTVGAAAGTAGAGGGACAVGAPVATRMKAEKRSGRGANHESADSAATRDSTSTISVVPGQRTGRRAGSARRRDGAGGADTSARPSDARRSRCQRSISAGVTSAAWCSVQFSAAIRSSASSTPTARRISRSKPLRRSSGGGREVLRHRLVVVHLGGEPVEGQRVADDAWSSPARRRRAGCALRRRRATRNDSIDPCRTYCAAIAAASGCVGQRRMEHLAHRRVRGQERRDAAGGRRSPRVRRARRRRGRRRSPSARRQSRMPPRIAIRSMTALANRRVVGGDVAPQIAVGAAERLGAAGQDDVDALLEQRRARTPTAWRWSSRRPAAARARRRARSATSRTQRGEVLGADQRVGERLGEDEPRLGTDRRAQRLVIAVVDDGDRAADAIGQPRRGTTWSCCRPAASAPRGAPGVSSTSKTSAVACMPESQTSDARRRARAPSAGR